MMNRINLSDLVRKLEGFFRNLVTFFHEEMRGEIEGKSRHGNPGHHRASNKYLKSSRKISKSGKLFVISDLHLNHRNIIRYCHRPFSNVGIMNKTIIQRWNKVVGPNDTVYFVGDFTLRGSPQYWKEKLKGRIIFIRGNHDQNIKNARHHVTLHHRGHLFYFVHNPHEAPTNWDGWIIHGHVHNNQMKIYPLINGDKKSINVSAELTDYYPLDLDKIINWDLTKIQRKNTVRSAPQYLSQPLTG
jgi:calcineurin-like phosphoesterase family protein